MGVRGIRHLLSDVGWIEKDELEADTANSPSRSECGCTGELWKEWNASDAFLGSNDSPPLERIPPNARFLIDGNGLAFYLHSIAYTRYLCSLEVRCGSASTLCTTRAGCCPTTKTIMNDKHATSLALPSMLPLSTLRSITREFVAGLKPFVAEIKVYWDGPARRFKAETDSKRQKERDQHESYEELYCNHGTLITASKKKGLTYTCQWQKVFPFSKLISTCVRHALLEEGGGAIEMIECEEEADIDLAVEASGDDRAFVLGFDSDFFFYKDMQYIPLNQMVIRSSSLDAFVARRSDLARLLGFSNDDRLIDLALLMGNDYVDPYVMLDVPEEIDLKNVRSMVYYLQCHEEFEANAKTDEGNTAVDFVRSLYNLHSLEAFPFDPDPSIPNDAGTDMQVEEDELFVLQQETTVRDGVLRCLRSILTQAGTDTKLPLTEQDVYAFEVSSVTSERPKMQNLGIRPSYRDTKAAKFIERIIARFYRKSPDSLLIRSTPPEFLMSRVHFYAVLGSLRDEAKEIEASDSEEFKVEEKSALSINPKPLRLPIDEHESAILENIRNHRVTIIHGETGCGKSSRVPVMLLNSPPPDGSLRKVKFFISQPRRIAAKALVERVRSCEPELKDKFALRMGHGWREYETSDTQAYFVTSGYLVRLLANHPERFDQCTHLVIDEVHERSVDTDILCLLCRRLLETNKTIRLVLMSATLATKMYRDYFGVPNEPIHVGVRRYKITEYFLEDLEHFGMPAKELKDALAIQKEIETKFCMAPPTSVEMQKRFGLTARLAIIVGEPGSSVLIFVPGMAEIIAISESIESFHKVGVRYTCFPIHGDIPFEEQMDAFDAPSEDEVKIIVATNAAESSVTLPNVDHVICLGLCRQITYNQASHRQMLTPAWISRASATQRAGRTGRVRPGNVYRIYTKMAYDKYMEEFEPGEMVRIPLDSVILMLKQIMHTEVKPVLLDCLEPPLLDTIDRSFQSLHYWSFLTEASDKADITSLGSFVSSLGIDLSLGFFVGLGIQFGVAAEAIEMAAMMSLPKTPFQITSLFWASPGKFNRDAAKTMASKCKFDSGLYSEPMMLMNALWDFLSVNDSKRNQWIYKNSIAAKRWRQVVSSRNSLRKRVADFLGIQEKNLEVQLPPREMPREKVFILRILKVWVFSDSIVECSPSKMNLSHDGSVELSIKARSKVKLEKSHLDHILQPEKHPFYITERNEIEQSGVFEEEGPFSFLDFVTGFERRILSYISEINVDSALCFSDECMYLYIEKSKLVRSNLMGYLDSIASVTKRQDRLTFLYTNIKRRGIMERAAGLWTITDTPNTDKPFSNKKEFVRIELNLETAGDKLWANHTSMIHEVISCDLNSKMIWYFFTQPMSKKSKKKKSSSQPFLLKTFGGCGKVSSANLEDLLGRKPLSVSTNLKNSIQSIILQQPANSRQKNTGEFQKPLFPDAPEAARILAVLASSQRKGNRNVLKIPRDSNNIDSEETYDFEMKEDEVNVSMRWRRLDSDKKVYVDSSVPSSAIHTSNNLYAVAANALELQRGGLRVETLTLLPPTPLFLLLSLLSFGVDVSTPLSWALIPNNDNESKEEKAKKKVNKSYAWLVDRAKKVSKADTSDEDKLIISISPLTNSSSLEPEYFWEKGKVKKRLEQAINFHHDSMSMGEKLVCFPEKIRELCELFCGVDGQDLSPWESIDDEALTEENLSHWRWERKTTTNEEHQRSSRRFPAAAIHQTVMQEAAKPSSLVIGPGTPQKPPKKKRLESHAIHHYDNQVIASSKTWFATVLESGDDMPAFPSTNILALLFQLFAENVESEENADSINVGKNFKIALNVDNWKVSCFKTVKGQSLYKARFVNASIPAVTIVGRGKNKLPKWIKKMHERPSTIKDAKECVPPNVECPNIIDGQKDGLLFDSIEDALKMESAFWLNQQFCHAGKGWKRHWYAHSMDQMIKMLLKHNNG